MKLSMPLKRSVFSALTALSVLLPIAPIWAAGTLPIALVQQVDINGQPVQCQVNFFVAGTNNTPQNSFQDFALTQTNPQTLACDQFGRVPMFWLADGLVHVRMIDSFGGVLIDTTMQVLGPSSGGGGGGGGTVDPTTILATGDEKTRYGTGSLTGFVRENGLTIGNATSGATERANADTQALFVYLYNTDPNLVVSGGRTGNALNDFNAAKTIGLPDMRGRVNGFLVDMGNTAAGTLTSTYFGNSVTTLGSAGGNQTHTLLLSELPGITSTNASQAIIVSGSNSFSASGNNAISVASNGSFPIGQNNTTTMVDFAPGGSGARAFSGATAFASQVTSTNGSQSIIVAGSVTINSSGNNNITVASTGTGGQPHSIVPPMLLKTIYMKL